MSVVHGGDTAAAFRVELASGRVLFAKTHSAPPAGFFTTEATGLAWLREQRGGAGSRGAGRVRRQRRRAGVPRARVDRAGSPADRRTSSSSVGELAALHDAGAPSFGREDRRTTGSLGLPNEPVRDVVGVRGAAPIPAAGPDRPRSAIVAARRRSIGWSGSANSLDRFDDGAGPARLHGDLWAGNRIVDVDGASWLIDPAAHGGHAEFDLAMMRLFGGFGADAFAGYETRESAGRRLARPCRPPPDRPARRPRHQVRRPLRRRRHPRHRPLHLTRSTVDNPRLRRENCVAERAKRDANVE